jgi:hypothetical protein
VRAFVFPLRRALEWRRTQLNLEENKLQRLTAALEELRLAEVRLDLVKARTEQAVREAGTVEANDLWALAAYRQRLMAQLRALAQQKREGEQQVAAQRRWMLEVQRQCRLLEKLEERRRAEWQADADREMEALAAESFLALWNRRGRP